MHIVFLVDVHEEFKNVPEGQEGVQRVQVMLLTLLQADEINCPVGHEVEHGLQTVSAEDVHGVKAKKFCAHCEHWRGVEYPGQ